MSMLAQHLPSFFVAQVSAGKGMDSLFAAPATLRAFVRHAKLFNASGSSGRAGLGSRFGIQTTGGVYNKYECGQISAAGVYTRDTTDFIDAGADDFPVSTTVDNTGCILAAYNRWNFAEIVVGTAEVGAAGTYAFQYWNGSAWVAFTPTDTLDFTSATTQYLLFTTPAAWVAGGNDDAGTAISQLANRYAIKIKATTAPTVSGALVTSGLLGTMQVMERVATAVQTDLSIHPDLPVVVGSGDALTSYWPAANAGNTVFARGNYDA